MADISKLKVPLAGGATLNIKDSTCRGFVAPEYDSSATYYRGHLVTYNGKLYCCIYAGTNDKLPTNTSYWVEATISDIGHVAQTALDDIAEPFSETKAYEVGDYCLRYASNVLYRCTQAGTGSGATFVRLGAVTDELKNKVSKSGDTMTGILYMQNTKVVRSSTSFDQANPPNTNRTYGFGDLTDKDKNTVMKLYTLHGANTGGIETILSAQRLKSGTTTTNEFKIGVDENSNKYEKVDGRLIVPSVGGSWVQGRDVTKNAINVDGQANNGQSYDGILWTKCYNGNIINVGRITNELDIAYIESGQTDDALRKYIKFAPAEDKVKFGTSGADKSYINLSNGSYNGDLNGKWAGMAYDGGTNNTTGTWVLCTSSDGKIQHRVMSTQLNTYIAASGVSGCVSSNNTTVDYIKCVRIGQMVTVTFSFVNSTAKTGELAWVALKSDFRPSGRIYFPCNIVGNSTAYTNESCHRMYIYADGTMKMWIDNTNATVSACMGSVSYCIN